MGLLADIFVAPPADALEYESLSSDRPALTEKYRPAEYRNLTGLEFTTLWAMLAGEEWSYEKHKLKEIRFSEGGETWLMQFPEPLVQLLAQLSESKVEKIAAAWSETDELQMRGGDDTAKLLRDLHILAKQSDESGQPMFLWGSL